jgi:hypothetical protein
MIRNYNAMSKKERAAMLQKLKSELEDFEETSHFHLMNSTAHISGKTVEQYEEELNTLKDTILEVEKL